MGKKGKPTSEHVIGLYGVTKDALFASRATISCPCLSARDVVLRLADWLAASGCRLLQVQ